MGTEISLELKKEKKNCKERVEGQMKEEEKALKKVTNKTHENGFQQTFKG